MLDEREQSGKDYSTAVMKLEKIRKQERYDELETIHANSGRGPKLSPRSFQTKIGVALEEMPEENRAEFGRELMVICCLSCFLSYLAIYVAAIAN